MRPTDVLNKIQREIKNSTKKPRQKTIRSGHVAIKIPIMEAENPSANKRVYSKEDMEKALEGSDCKIKPVTTNKKEDNDLATFIKENIINKKPEYPEYDSATPQSTISDLVQKTREMKKEWKPNKIEVIVVESRDKLPAIGLPNTVYYIPIIGYERDGAYKTYVWVDDDKGGRWLFNGYENAKKAVIINPDPERKVEYSTKNISPIAKRAVDLTINDKPKKSHEDEIDALKYSLEHNNGWRKWEEVKDLYFNDAEGLQYALESLHINHVNVNDNSVEECLEAINSKVDSIHVQWKKTHDKFDNFDDFLDASPYVDVFRNLKHVYIINGYAKSGKDTFVNMTGDVFDFLESSKNTTKSISSVQGIKDISATYFGYDESIKSDKDRKFLSDFKAITTEYCDYSLKYVLKEILRADLDGYSYIFIHIREPEEIKRAVEMIDKIIFPHFSSKVAEYEYDTGKMLTVRKNYAPKTIFVKRENVRRVTNNTSDTEVEKYDYDFVIDNSGSLDSLKMYAKHFAIQEFG